MKHPCPILRLKKLGEYETLKAKVKKGAIGRCYTQTYTEDLSLFSFSFVVVLVGKEERRPAIDAPIATTSQWQGQHSKLFRIFLNVEYFLTILNIFEYSKIFLMLPTPQLAIWKVQHWKLSKMFLICFVESKLIFLQHLLLSCWIAEHVFAPKLMSLATGSYEIPLSHIFRSVLNI